MITDPKVRKRRIEKLLDRSGGGTSTTNSPDRLPEPVATEIVRGADLAPGEDGLLASFRASNEWCLLTTERLIWLRGGKLHAFTWPEIHGVQQPPAITSGIIRGELQKDAVEELEVFNAEGDKYTLCLERGGAYHLVWSAVVALCDLRRPPDPINLGDSASAAG